MFHVDGDNYVTYIKNTMGDLQTAIRVASDTGLPGAGDVFAKLEIVDIVSFYINILFKIMI